MNEIKKPKIKSEDSAGRFKELIRFLYELVDNLNWCLQTLENSVMWQKKRLSAVIAEEESTSKSETETETCSARFKRVGKSVYVILNCYPGEGNQSAGTANLVIPAEFAPTFYDSSVAVAKTDEMTCFLSQNKITIDYDFAEGKASSGVYFQYIS